MTFPASPGLQSELSFLAQNSFVIWEVRFTGTTHLRDTGHSPQGEKPSQDAAKQNLPGVGIDVAEQ